MFSIKDLTIKAQDKELIHNLNLTINDGEIHVLMGPNGTGKSTICQTIFHHPAYEIANGSITYHDHLLNDLTPTEISRLGLFLLNQNPIEIEGITNAELLRNALNEKNDTPLDIFKFNDELNEVCKIIDLPKEFVHRDINYNMSGGEKKKNELLHLFILKPSFIILDEIDSGLDVDALKTVGEALKKYYELYHPSILIVTHHNYLLDYFSSYQVHILKDGHIVQSGSKELAKQIEKTGFEANIINDNKKYE